MPFYPTAIEGLIVFEPNLYQDARGYFFESYNQLLFQKNGIDNTFVQDNQARSAYGVLRGLHYQTGSSAQAKLVRVTEGEVYDVAVDLRKESPTYLQSFGIHLSAENKKQLFIPKGFAHGYLVISPVAEFCYKCDKFYDKEAEGGIRFDDPALKIQWPLEPDKIIISEKDRQLPYSPQHRPVW